jgi:hypothetical protein
MRQDHYQNISAGCGWKTAQRFPNPFWHRPAAGCWLQRLMGERPIMRLAIGRGNMAPKKNPPGQGQTPGPLAAGRSMIKPALRDLRSALSAAVFRQACDCKTLAQFGAPCALMISCKRRERKTFSRPRNVAASGPAAAFTRDQKVPEALQRWRQNLGGDTVT